MIHGSLLSLILLFSSGALSQELIKVIAVEYPPFLSSQSDDFGTNFVLLKQYADTHFQAAYEPHFIPPRRAQHKIDEGEWCVSFYPPRPGNAKANFVALSPDLVKLGLYRQKQFKAFHYTDLSELSGSVAILRTNSLGRMHKMLQDAGLTLVHLETVEQGIHMLLAGRVNYAFGDNTSLETYAHIKKINTLQFSEVALSEYPVGFYYNADCESKLFKAKP